MARQTVVACLVGVIFPLVISTNAAEPLSAEAAVSANEVFVGEPFRFQIRISGSENPQKPDLSGLAGFIVEDLGGQRNSSRNVTIINGRMSEVVNRGYVLDYRLVAQRTGNLTIPALAITTDRGTVKTRPIAIRAKKPTETENFKLRLNLSTDTCYVGEPVMLTVTWYLGQNVKEFQFSLPVLNDDHFLFADVSPDSSKNQELYRIPIGQEEVIAEKSQGKLDGRTYTTIIFRKVLIPKQSGHVTIDPAMVACEALVGYRKSRDPFGRLFNDDFFDDFFGGRKGMYDRLVVPSNTLTLDIRELPAVGRPTNFSGHIGRYRIETRATPIDVSVGDPITLTVALSGPAYLEHVTMPPLNEQNNLARDFKIPVEMADGKVVDGVKNFTQTIRALRPDVLEVPPIELPYFDTEIGEYRVARSRPIPLKVKAARVVTAADAEGRDLPVASTKSLKAWTRGIAHNYEGPDLLVNQQYGPAVWLRSPIWVLLLSAPPISYALLLSCVVFVRGRNADPQAARQRRAFAEASRRLQKTHGSPTEILQALQTYFADKFRFPGSTVTFPDVRAHLQKHHVDDETQETLRSLFNTCEAGRYAGNALSDVDGAALARQAVDVLKRIEKKLK